MDQAISSPFKIEIVNGWMRPLGAMVDTTNKKGGFSSDADESSKFHKVGLEQQTG